MLIELEAISGAIKSITDDLILLQANSTDTQSQTIEEAIKAVNWLDIGVLQEVRTAREKK